MAANADTAESTAEQDVHGRTPSATSKTNLHQNLAALEQLDAGRCAPSGVGCTEPGAAGQPGPAVRGVAYRLQELQLGGLSKATRRKLAAFAKELEASGSLRRRPAHK